MRNYKKTLFAAIFIFTISVLSSCSTEQAVFTASEDVTERIDMVLEGDDHEYIFKQSEQSDQGEDLVDFNFYGQSAYKIDFKVNLDDHRTLIFRIVNEIVSDPWESEMEYSMFASQDLEDKQQYVTAELISGGESATHTSHVEGSFPQGTYLNVFHIVDFNPANNEILCRLIELPMISTTGDGEVMTISGTFRGSLTFLD